MNDVIKCLIHGMKYHYEDNEYTAWGTPKWNMPVRHIIEVLEKQLEQESVDKVEPKFKVGDWVVSGRTIIQISDIQGQYYIGTDIYGNDLTSRSDKIHLWTIADAKDGDVLVTDFGEDDLIVMYKSRCTIDTINVHCCLGNEFTCSNIGLFNAEDVKPATKEQRNLLFQKMKEDGWEWDNEKKELKKIDVKNVDNDKPKFHTGDWIVRSAEGVKYNAYLVKEIKDYYVCEELKGRRVTFTFNDVHKNFKLWDISDAKRGDVLVDVYGNIGIFDKCYDFDWMSCCSLENNESFQYFTVKHENEKTYPATKEQRELLFEKITQAGWNWNAENKELSKQTLKITPKFCIGQLITDDNGTWYQITNIKCLDDWYYELYDVCEDNTHLELCSIIDERFRENRFVGEIKKMMGD